jgi:hypothetical protein
MIVGGAKSRTTLERALLTQNSSIQSRRINP